MIRAAAYGPNTFRDVILYFEAVVFLGLASESSKGSQKCPSGVGKK